MVMPSFSLKSPAPSAVVQDMRAPRTCSLIDLTTGQPDVERRGTTVELHDEPWERRPSLLSAVGAFQAGDAVAALDAVLEVLADQPGHAGATDFLDRIGPQVEKALRRRLGRFDRAPRIAVALEDLHTFPLDAEEVFVLTRADGCTTFNELCHLMGRPRPVTLRTLDRLVEAGLLALPTGS